MAAPGTTATAEVMVTMVVAMMTPVVAVGAMVDERWWRQWRWR